MSRIARSELAPLADEIRRLIVERLGTKDDFMVTPAVIAELFGDNNIDSFNLRQALECHTGNVMARTSHFLVHLHAALVAKGHGRLNPYEISSCDRRVSFIETGEPKVKLLAFENQNFTYMVLLKPDIMTKYVGDKIMQYEMHVRASTPAAPQNHYRYNNPGIKRVPYGNKLANEFTDYHGYFRFLDSRDRGFVGCIKPEQSYKVAADGKFTDRDEIVWIGKDAVGSIFGANAILDELKAYTTMAEETFEELEYKVVDKASEGG